LRIKEQETHLTLQEHDDDDDDDDDHVNYYNEIHELYSSPNIIRVSKDSRVGAACSMYGGKEKCL